ncbi:hypothetical protein PVK06_005843 [Gossypium arboreum]|uniref:Reverse transcriptase domain-containing protein n=1 Tax=Gossypium arboreum TaxID=29729 RepID=A0ABR0QVM8_GOSAR|nr:hypothetical protein PVK06_005843 [Gossypium arboreum]
MTLSDIIIPERGLRQGDLLSPYLFLLCMDALSRMLTNAQETNHIKGIRASKDGPRINHLFFADDALLFVRNKRSEVKVFTQILESFKRMSVQSINLDKSMVYFSPNTPVTQRTTLSGLLKMKVVTNLDGYLGLPIPIGKQVWRLISCKDTLCFRVLRAKYFSDGDFFHPEHIDKPSFTWQSIAKAASLLYEGFGWNVGRVSKFDIWHDKWGFEGLSGDSFGLSKREVQEEKVHNLLNNEKDGWNERRVIEIYGEDLEDQICKIPILHNGPEDYRIWFYNPLGYYSTKSAYSWLTLKHVGFGPHRVF